MSVDGPIPRTLRARVDGSSRRSIEDAFVSVAGMFDRAAAEVKAMAGPEVADVRTVRLRVLDRLGEPWLGCWPVRLWISTTAGGPPGGTQTIAVVAGTLGQSIIADKYIEVFTGADGIAEVDLGVTGAGSRFVTAFVAGVPGAALATVFA